MKIKLSVLYLKALLFIIFIVFGILIFTPCGAQTVVGKWKRTDTNRFTIDTTTGKLTPGSDEVKQQFNDHMASVGYEEILELKSDHTYVSTVTTNDNPKGTPHSNTWSLSGNLLDMNIPIIENQKTLIKIKSLNNKTMIWDIIYLGSPTKLAEVTYTKM